MGMGIIALYHGQLEVFAAFSAFFGVCAAFKIIPKKVTLKQDTTSNVLSDRVVSDFLHRKKNKKLYKLGLFFARLPVVCTLFEYELKRVERKIPYTGQVIDAKRFVMYTAITTVLCLVSLSVIISIIVALSGVVHLYLIVVIPLLIPLVSPVLLDGAINDRKSKTSSEFLAFVTYAGIMHTIQKTMFWTMQTMCNSVVFSQLKNDSQIVLRYAKGGGEEEGHAISLMAQYHPDRNFREFLEKYVSYIPTNITRLRNHVETAREESLHNTMTLIKSYTDTANMIFFIGVMAVSILPILLTVMSFLPNTGFDGVSLIGVMFILPLIFVIFPVFLSTGTIFLQTRIVVSHVSVLAGIICCITLFVIFPEHWITSTSVSISVFAGINWRGVTAARQDRDAINADKQLPDMLDYIAEQKKSKNNMMEIFLDYSILPNTHGIIKKILQDIASDILIKPSQHAFLQRVYPSKTTQFVFFMLHAVYEHGGGTYESVISMAHSIRRISEMKDSFVASARLSVVIVVLSPAVFMFCVMMTSFMTFGIPGSDLESGDHIPAGIMMIKADEVANIVKSLQPVSLIIAVAGGLGVSRAVCYSFLHTQHLFFATVTSSVCLLLWDVLFGVLQQQFHV